MKAPITIAQAMSHPYVVLTINTLGKMADELRAERDALKADAERYRWLQHADDIEWESLKFESPEWRNAVIDATMKGKS